MVRKRAWWCHGCFAKGRKSARAGRRSPVEEVSESPRNLQYWVHWKGVIKSGETGVGRWPRGAGGRVEQGYRAIQA